MHEIYNFQSMQMQRQMISQRLSTMDQGHSFLSRQRQASTRRVPMGTNMGNRLVILFVEIHINI